MCVACSLVSGTLEVLPGMSCLLSMGTANERASELPLLSNPIPPCHDLVIGAYRLTLVGVMAAFRYFSAGELLILSVVDVRYKKVETFFLNFTSLDTGSSLHRGRLYPIVWVEISPQLDAGLSVSQHDPFRGAID